MLCGGFLGELGDDDGYRYGQGENKEDDKDGPPGVDSAETDSPAAQSDLLADTTAAAAAAGGLVGGGMGQDVAPLLPKLPLAAVGSGDEIGHLPFL